MLNNMAWTRVAVVSRLPATVAPVGFGDSGLPVGIQIIGAKYEDRTTIDFAKGLSELLGYSGAIAALSFGITLGNVQALKLPLISKYTPLNPLALSKREKAFFSEVVFIVKTFFFVYMGISINFENLALTGLAFLLVILMFSI